MSSRHATQLSRAVIDALTACEIDGLHVRLPQLDYALYVEVNDALSTIGGRWDKRLRAHVFAADPRPRIDRMLDEGQSIDSKKLYQAYFTPPELALRMAEMLCLRPDSHAATILEPSAGHGAIAKACLDLGIATRVDCVEVDPEKIPYLENIGSMHPGRVSVYCGDFLSLRPIARYDAVLMNPPFGGGADVKHILHARQFLKPRGATLVAICANGPRQHRDLRLIADHYEALPEGSFKLSGTMVNAALCVFNT